MNKRNFIPFLGAMVVLAAPAHAALVHYYSGGSTNITDDQVGSANGTLLGAATLSGGNLVTDGGNGGLSGGVPAQGMQLSSSAVSGITGSFTIYTWFSTVVSSGNQDFLFAFSDGTGTNMLTALPADGSGFGFDAHAYTGLAGSYVDVRNSSFDNGPGGGATDGWLDTGATFQMALTYDGANLSMYVNGQLQPTAALTGFNLSNLTTIAVAGGSPWTVNDDSINGTTYSFAILDEALNQTQVTNTFNLGANASAAQVIAAIPEPSAALLGGLGMLALLRRRRS